MPGAVDARTWRAGCSRAPASYHRPKETATIAATRLAATRDAWPKRRRRDEMSCIANEGPSEGEADWLADQPELLSRQKMVGKKEVGPVVWAGP